MTESTKSTTNTRITAEFEITGWDESTYHESPDDGPRLTRATVHKSFRGGVEGTSVTELLTAQGTHGRGYLASELFSGTIDGRRGTVVFQHGGTDDRGTLRSFGHIVPGTGTAELTGLTGEVVYVHDESGARVTIRLDPA